MLLHYGFYCYNSSKHYSNKSQIKMFNLKSLVCHEDMTDFCWGECYDLTNIIMYFCVTIDLSANGELCICGFMKIYLKCMG